jgi:Fe-S oxidoreductase
MFHDSKCDFCGDCLARCMYLDFDREQGAREFERLVNGEDVEWLKDCITCFACNEYCTKGAKPFDLILERMEASGNYVNPKIVSALKKNFASKSEFNPPELQGPVMSLCTIEPNMPYPIKGKLFEGLSFVRGRHFFCNVLFPHVGNESIMRDNIQTLVDKYASLAVDEIIFLHDDCYSLMAGIAPTYGIELSFRPIHIFEYLVNYLKNHTSDINHLNMKIAYQRPCASRFTPWKEPMLDKIFTLIGVERVARKYDGKHSLCCGQDMKGLVKRGRKFPEYQDVNINDAKNHAAEAMIFLCPMCYDALASKCEAADLRPLMVTDLCHLALGEVLKG